MQDHLLLSTSYNQGLYDIKQLTNDSNEANQWCIAAMITICYFTINAFKRLQNEQERFIINVTMPTFIRSKDYYALTDLSIAYRR